jgi:protein-S-isoprenylcysteine O-methyltransferase Ste14
MNKSAAMKEKKGEHPFGDAGQLILLVLFITVWVLDSFFLKKTIFPADYIPFYIRLTIFILLFIAALLLFRATKFIIEGEKRPDHVVNTGAYKYIRHPMYLGSILMSLSLTILTASISSCFIFIAIFVFYNYIASYEEKLLENKFGKAYKEYKSRTGRWLPRLCRVK